MKTLLVTAPEAKIKCHEVRKLVPHKLTGWHITGSSCETLDRAEAVPDVTLVQISDATRPAEVKSILPRLAHIQSKSHKRSYVVFSFKQRVRAKPGKAQAQQRRFHDVMTQINHELRTFPNPELVNVTFAPNASAIATELEHIRAKLDLPSQLMDVRLPQGAPRPSQLDEVTEVVKATEDLRVANGNLSATAVASAFGVSLNQLAVWLGRSRQALTKTPDADSLQDELAFFERIARLRVVVPKDRFLKWLRMPNAQLENATPLQLIAKGERQVVADLVDDALTGAPT